MDNWVDPIKELVAFDFRYDTWDRFKTKLKGGDENAWVEFDIIVNSIAREYSRGVEREYSKTVLCWECEEYFKTL